jgi:hypothetical protein
MKMAGHPAPHGHLEFLGAGNIEVPAADARQLRRGYLFAANECASRCV